MPATVVVRGLDAGAVVAAGEAIDGAALGKVALDGALPDGAELEGAASESVPGALDPVAMPVAGRPDSLEDDVQALALSTRKTPVSIPVATANGW